MPAHLLAAHSTATPKQAKEPSCRYIELNDPKRRKKLVRMKTHLIFTALLLTSLTLIAQEQTFIKEYTYNASEIDSKVSCRAIAINQLRSQLLNEIGVYVQSESTLKTSDVGGKFSQDFVENIATISAGITKLEILEERWNGETFWMKASIKIDPKSLEESLKQVRSDRQHVKELEVLKQQIENANAKISALTHQLNNVKEEKEKASIAEQYNNEIEIFNVSDLLFNGMAKSQLGDRSGAIGDFNKVIEIDPNNSYAYINRGIEKYWLGDYSSSLRDFDKAIKLNPEFELGLDIRGLVKGALGDFAGAIKDFNRLIEIDPMNASGYSGLGAIKGRIGDFSGAIQALNKAIELDPTHASDFQDRGTVKDKSGDLYGAIRDFNRAIELDPNDGNTYSNRGSVKYRLNDYQGAIVDYSKAIELNPNDGDAYNARGHAKANLRDKSACSDWRMASQLGIINASEMIRKYCN